MSKRNWVCFECRSAVRREYGTAKVPICATCSLPLVNLGYRIPIPTKARANEWEALRVQYLVEQRQGQARRSEDRGKERRFLEKEIDRLESLPPNPGRIEAVRQLRRRLNNLGA